MTQTEQDHRAGCRGCRRAGRPVRLCRLQRLVVQQGPISVVGFSVLKTANEPVIAAFQKTSAGKGVTFTTSYGASGDQSRAVAGGLHADEVHLSLTPDVQSLVDAGLVDKGWDQNATHGILTDSEVVFLVRKGNPLHIKGWDDLVKPGVKVITPNPASSGSAKWNILAAYAHAKEAAGGSDATAKTFVTKLLNNAVALPGSGSDALVVVPRRQR